VLGYYKFKYKQFPDNLTQATNNASIDSTILQSMLSSQADIA